MRYRIDIVKTKVLGYHGIVQWRTALLANLGSLHGPPEWHALGGKEDALFESVDGLIRLIIEDDRLREEETSP